MTVGRATAGSRFGLLGDPVAHSVSPEIYRAAFRLLGVDAEYVAFRVEAAGLEEAVRDLAAGGGGNATLPHKERVAKLLQSGSAAVEATGACNCFWQDDTGRLCGDNTDVEGFRAAVLELGATLDGARVLLLGAGGAARAVTVACLAGGAGRVDIHNRTASRAARLAEELGGEKGRVRCLKNLGEAKAGYDLVVNATSLGLHGSDPLPADLTGFAIPLALDLTYAPGGTRWTEHAERLGMRAVDGVTMLVHQAGRSLVNWLGTIEPPLQAMRQAAREALLAARRSA